MIASVLSLAECAASPYTCMVISDLEAVMGAGEWFLEDCSPFFP